MGTAKKRLLSNLMKLEILDQAEDDLIEDFPYEMHRPAGSYSSSILRRIDRSGFP